jgi:hypothetical protein
MNFYSDTYFFILFFRGHLLKQKNLGHQPTPREAAKELIDGWNTEFKPHMVLDAAFGSLELGKFLHNKGYIYTMGVNTGNQNKLPWDEMKKGLAYQEGRVMKNKDGVLASIFMDNKHHTVFTTGWEMDEEEQEEEEENEEENKKSSESDNDDNTQTNQPK